MTTPTSPNNPRKDPVTRPDKQKNTPPARPVEKPKK